LEFVVHLALCHVRIAVVVGRNQGLLNRCCRRWNQWQQNPAHFKQGSVLSSKRSVNGFKLVKAISHLCSPEREVS